MGTDSHFRFDDKMNYDFQQVPPVPVNLGAVLNRMEQAELIRQRADEDGTYWFKHVLTQDAAYASLLLKKRREIHRRVAQAYERVEADHLEANAALLAWHYAEAGEDAKAAGYYIRAGDASVRVFAASEARLHYTSATELLRRLPETPDTRRAHFETLVKYSALALGAEDASALLTRYLDAEALGQGLSGENNPSDRRNLAHLRFEIARVFLTLNRPFQAFAYCDLIRQDAQVLGDEGLSALAVGLQAIGEMDQGHFGQAITGFPAAIKYLASIGNWREWAWMNMNLAFALAEHGDFHGALELGARVRRRAEETQDYWMRCVTALYHSLIYWAGGEIPESLASARTLMQLAVEGHELVFVQLGSLPQMWAESKLGDHAAAARTLAQRQALIERVGVEIVWADWGAAARAEMGLNTGEFAKAIVLAEYAVQVAQAVGGIFAEGLAQRTWAQALGTNEAAAHFALSLQLFEVGGARLEAARTHVAWGRACTQTGDYLSARKHFEEAAAQFQASELTSELEQTKQLIHSLSPGLPLKQ